ncbi:MAG: exodeoxyribonuclease VII small subunit [Bacillota bacterium]
MAEKDEKTPLEEKSFEELMESLEEVVQSLENGDLPLEDAVKKYEEGMKLSKACHSKLEHAEKVLTKKMTDEGETAFDLDDENTEQ